MSRFKERLLVTGGCGFIGSHFVNHYFYENSDCHIINIDAMYYCASQENVLPEIRNSNRYTFIKGNLCSLDFVSHILEVYQINRVVHFAAQSHVQNSFEDSLQYTNDNVLGTHTLLEACRRYSLGIQKFIGGIQKSSDSAGIQKFIGGIQKFIHISTDEVYGESMLGSDSDKKTEESVLCPTNPYAATKAAAELIAQSYYHSFKQLPQIQEDLEKGKKVVFVSVFRLSLINYLDKDEKDLQENFQNLKSLLRETYEIEAKEDSKEYLNSLTINVLLKN
jgi:dTDP-D-glucose 4,6-dehydratase